MRAVILDLFAGPGGWSEGLRQIGLSDVGIEWDAAACATRKAAGHLTIRADVAQYPIKPFIGKVTGLIASPPCQDFSQAGRRAGVTGEKGKLIWEPLRWAQTLLPRWCAFEQVPEAMWFWHETACQLRLLGYRVAMSVLNAADYGVPQARERAFLLASLNGPVRLPTPTHAAGGVTGLFGDIPAWRSWGDATGRSDDWRLEHIRGSGMVERHGQRPPRLATEPSFTVLAWKDSRMRWVHEDGTRERFTVRDSLTLQTFPADYPVQGSDTRAQEQIGNAVPPLFAAHVLSAVTGLRIPSSEVAA